MTAAATPARKRGNSLPLLIVMGMLVLVITLISAAVLRKKPRSQPAPSPLPASS